ncbi:hypothetical protein [Pseudomonas sp. ICMP 561]|uniref:hypothetical protein n=1 Tax=Pseudomonas sp. ICMP 561 TaxID=1718918 RepID=UPI000C0715FE|nr:hypothetical protein [Pseudomonas sp. ICMP 561]PHN28966.1 hypothetical protein AO242_26135 [Pseudomonas sp. ICMP 561]
MTNEERRVALQEAGVALYDATLTDQPEKLMLKLRARDTIELVLSGTVAEGIAGQLKNEIVPLCQPFSEANFILIAALAGMVAGGDKDLSEAYKIRLLAADWGS